MNESIKLTAAFLNNLAVGSFVGGLIAPTAAGRPLNPLWYVALTVVALALHLVGRFLLESLRSED